MSERTKEILEGIGSIVVGTPIALGVILLLMMIAEDMRLG